MKKQLQSSTILLLATMIWALALVFQSAGMDHIGPFTFQAARCLLGAIFLMPVIAINDRSKNDTKSFVSRWADPKLWKAGLLCGIPLGLGCLLQQVGLQYTDVGKSAFLTTMYILIVPIIGIFLKKKPSVMVLISMPLAVVGLYFLSCVGVMQINVGDLITFAGAFMFATQIIFVDIFAKGADALRLNAIQSLMCSIVAAVPMLLTETPSWETILSCAFPLVYTGCISMGLGYFMQIVGQKHLNPTAAALIMSLESVFAAIFGVLFLREMLSSWELLGCGLVFCAVILSQIPIKEKKAVHPS